MGVPVRQSRTFCCGRELNDSIAVLPNADGTRAMGKIRPGKGVLKFFRAELESGVGVNSTLNLSGFVGDFILWKQGWSHGQKQQTRAAVFV